MSHLDSATRKRKMADCNPDAPSNGNIDSDPLAKRSKIDALACIPTIMATHKDPRKVYVVAMRVTDDNLACPLLQSAFFSYSQALSCALQILLDFCKSHYDDYVWKGPDKLAGDSVSRYIVYHTQTEQRLAVADVIEVGISDAGESEVDDSALGSGEEEAEISVQNPPAGGAVLEKLPAPIANRIATETARIATDLQDDQNVWQERHDIKMFGVSTNTEEAAV